MDADEAKIYVTNKLIDIMHISGVVNIVVDFLFRIPEPPYQSIYFRELPYLWVL